MKTPSSPPPLQLRVLGGTSSPPSNSERPLDDDEMLSYHPILTRLILTRCGFLGS
jgi:hypothetical protein